ncbi:hypothetical protein HK097_005002, partial [Rhizophlyctis rosea]
MSLRSATRLPLTPRTCLSPTLTTHIRPLQNPHRTAASDSKAGKKEASLLSDPRYTLIREILYSRT